MQIKYHCTKVLLLEFPFHLNHDMDVALGDREKRFRFFILRLQCCRNVSKYKKVVYRRFGTKMFTIHIVCFEVDSMIATRF